MTNPILRRVKRFVSPAFRHLEGRRGVRILGHRTYVGGMWEEVGQLQFDYLIARGLQPDDCFLDIACGSLRGGVHFIRYLEPGNYLGLDKQQELIDLGIEKELGRRVVDEKRPEFVISESFEFTRFSKCPQYSLAQSLFTHLTEEAIALCLSNLRGFVASGHRFFATFFEGSANGNPTKSLSLGRFEYTRDRMAQLGIENGWNALYRGDWNHPREQMMMEFIAP